MNAKLTETYIRERLSKLKSAKSKHKKGKSCDMKSGHTCGACHFYSGAILALSDLIGEKGITE